jgi:hypothetical protein
MKPLEVKGIDTVQITVGSEFEKHLGEPIRSLEDHSRCPQTRLGQDEVRVRVTIVVVTGAKDQHGLASFIRAFAQIVELTFWIQSQEG